MVHVSEGIDERSRKEFDILKAKHLLTAQTAIIHGTAFGDAEFKEMAQVGAKLIWSPQSNLALYGKTTNIPLALKHGVPVSLGIDWNPTSSDDMFSEHGDVPSSLVRVGQSCRPGQGRAPDSGWSSVDREQFQGAIKDEA